jgi:hypothetical protein
MRPQVTTSEIAAEKRSNVESKAVQFIPEFVTEVTKMFHVKHCIHFTDKTEYLTDYFATDYSHVSL